MTELNEIIKKKKDSELINMVYQFEEWSPEMLNAIEEELSNRNILPTDIQQAKQRCIEEEYAKLSEGKEASTIGQIVGWLTVFGLIGTIIGYHYAFSKVKSKYTGETYFTYNESSRKDGKTLFTTSIAIFIIVLLYKLLF